MHNPELFSMHNEPRSGELCIGNNEGLCICQIHPIDPLCIGITLIFTTLTVLDIVFYPFYALGLLKEVKPNIPNGRWGNWEMWSYKGMTQNQRNVVIVQPS